jgi:hypothetical protein
MADHLRDELEGRMTGRRASHQQAAGRLRKSDVSRLDGLIRGRDLMSIDAAEQLDGMSSRKSCSFDVNETLSDRAAWALVRNGWELPLTSPGTGSLLCCVTASR